MSEQENNELLGNIMSLTCKQLLARTVSEEARWGRMDKTITVRALIATAAQLSIAASGFNTRARSTDEVIAAANDSRHAVYLSCDLLDWAELLLVNPGSGFPVGHPDWVAVTHRTKSKFDAIPDVGDCAIAQGIFAEAADLLPRFLDQTCIRPEEIRVVNFLHELLSTSQYDEFKDACESAYRRVR